MLNHNQTEMPTTQTGCPDDDDFPGIMLCSRINGKEMYFHVKAGEYIPEDMISNVMRIVAQ